MRDVTPRSSFARPDIQGHGRSDNQDGVDVAEECGRQSQDVGGLLCLKEHVEEDEDGCGCHPWLTNELDGGD